MFNSKALLTVMMLLGLGAVVEEVMEPFNPEVGAYAAGGHDHRHHPHD